MNSQIEPNTQSDNDESLQQSFSSLNEIDQSILYSLFDLAHEIRTPNSLIQGYVNLLLQEDIDCLTEKQKKHLSIIRDSAANNVKIWDEYFDRIRFLSGWSGLQFEQVNLESFIHQITDGMREDAHKQYKQALQSLRNQKISQENIEEVQKRHERTKPRFKFLIPESLPSIWADRLRLQQAIMPILDAAIRSANVQNTGDVLIQLDHDPEKIIFSTTCSGVGLTKVYFARHEWALISAVIERHGGKIQVESQEGEDSTFTFTLPIVKDNPTLK